jgi:acetylornithine deacetylase/succinyl-diaminopimelate desuccinylase-like protein
MKSIGAPRLHGEPGFSTLERLWARPTLDINGIWSGFTGVGAKTVIPAEARAKVSMRLVPVQKPDEIAGKVARFLEKVAPPSVEVNVEVLHGAEAWTTPLDGAGLRAAGLALRRAFGRHAVFVREGGSIPVVADFEKILHVPVVLMGFGLNDDNLHAPNEKMDLDNFYGGILAAAYLMEELAAAGNGNGKARSRPSRRRA